jgi:hypothetical protein
MSMHLLLTQQVCQRQLQSFLRLVKNIYSHVCIPLSCICIILYSHEYMLQKANYFMCRVGIEHTQGEGPGAYISATLTKPPETTQTLEEKPEPPAADSDTDSSS